MGRIDILPATSEGVEDGIQWKTILTLNGSVINGYVLLPDGHPLRELDYWDMDISAHGGLTFFEDGWIGFDTAHAGDIWTAEELQKHGGNEPLSVPTRSNDSLDNWTLERVEKEVKDIIRQVKEYTNASD